MPSFLDVKPSITFPISELLRQYPIHSQHVIAHIRKATVGGVTLGNYHPFRRELWERYWVFAHNGDLPNFYPENADFYRSVGQTNGERAFYLILETLRQIFPVGQTSLEKLYVLLRDISVAIAASYDSLSSTLRGESAHRPDIGFLRAKRLITTADPPQKVVSGGELIEYTPVDVEYICSGLIFAPRIEPSQPNKKLERLPNFPGTLKGESITT
jgi:predicted glutamine amidotransferase